MSEFSDVFERLVLFRFSSVMENRENLKVFNLMTLISDEPLKSLIVLLQSHEKFLLKKTQI